MGTVGWIAVSISGVGVGYFVLSVALGRTVPPAFSGRLLLRKKLRRYGVDPARFDDASLSEFVQEAIEFSELEHDLVGTDFTTVFVDILDGMAACISGQPKRARNARYHQILSRYENL